MLRKNQKLLLLFAVFFFVSLCSFSTILIHPIFFRKLEQKNSETIDITTPNQYTTTSHDKMQTTTIKLKTTAKTTTTTTTMQSIFTENLHPCSYLQFFG